jgi:ribosomal protein L13
MDTTNTTTHTIDAAGKRLGEVATEAAAHLMGKHEVSFARNTVSKTTVTIENASQLDIPDRKREEIYQSYSGYPGGRKTETLDHLANRLGYAEVVRRTVGGMLPNNKLKKILLANLTITE